MSFHSSISSISPENDECIPLYRLSHDSHLKGDSSFILSPPHFFNDSLHKNILRSQQTVHSANCLRRETDVRLLCEFDIFPMRLHSMIYF